MSRAFRIEPLEGRTLHSCDPSLEGVNLDAAMQSKAHFLGTEVGNFLTSVQSFIYDRALAQPLPLIGAPFKGLKGTSKDLLQPLINKVSALTLQANELTICPMYDKLDGAIGAGGAAPASESVAAATGNTIDAKIFNPPNWSIGQPIFDAGFDMTLRGTLVDHTFTPSFDLGLPALGLKLNGGLKVDLTYEVRLVVGLDQDGFYLETGLTQPGPNNTTKSLPEIKLMVDVTAPGLTFAGSLGFLKLNATDHGTHLTGELDVDLQDGPDADTKLRVPELNTAPQLIKTAKITGDSHLDLHVGRLWLGDVPVAGREPRRGRGVQGRRPADPRPPEELRLATVGRVP